LARLARWVRKLRTDGSHVCDHLAHLSTVDQAAADWRLGADDGQLALTASRSVGPVKESDRSSR